MRYLAARALLPDGWHDDVLIDVDERGRIVEVAPGGELDGATLLQGHIVPAMPNAHSHAFQRVLAAAVQRREGEHDSFWSWRTNMYRLAGELDPDSLEQLAFSAYREMREAGYGAVAEFHYLHAAPGGERYANISEMSDRLIAAARAAELPITLLPVMYLHGDFGGAPLSAAQRRFSLGVDGYLELWHKLAAEYRHVPAVRIGFAPHSLRAVTLEELRYVAAEVRGSDATAPIHLHIAEQQREVEACLALHGRHPIELLYDSLEVDERWCLVHATHADRRQLERIARSRAVVVLCPTTEADLGDGIFAARTFVELGGRFAIGSDSNVRVDPAEELRWLEYGQRLVQRERNVFCDEAEPSVGTFLYRRALAGGEAALGQRAGAIAPGYPGDLLQLQPGRHALDDFVFARAALPVRRADDAAAV